MEFLGHKNKFKISNVFYFLFLKNKHAGKSRCNSKKKMKREVMAHCERAMKVGYISWSMKRNKESDWTKDNTTRMWEEMQATRAQHSSLYINKIYLILRALRPLFPDPPPSAADTAACRLTDDLPFSVLVSTTPEPAKWYY